LRIIKVTGLWLSGVNFKNVLQAAFAHTDPESTKKTGNLTVFFTLLGSEQVKAAHRTLMKFILGREPKEGKMQGYL